MDKLLSLLPFLQGVLANSYVHMAMVAMLAIYGFLNTNWKKPAVWIVVHGALLVAAAVLAYTHLDTYLGAGAVASVLAMGSQWLTTKLNPLSNKLEYAKTFVQNLLFYPVHVVDAVYSWVSAHLS